MGTVTEQQRSPKQIRAEWVRQLRLHGDRQCDGYLCDPDNHQLVCALGLLVEVVEGPGCWSRDDMGVFGAPDGYGTCINSSLPTHVRVAAGLTSHQECDVVTWNDDVGLTFAEIAECVEAWDNNQQPGSRDDGTR